MGLKMGLKLGLKFGVSPSCKNNEYAWASPSANTS